jgi:hypothetical protein
MESDVFRIFFLGFLEDFRDFGQSDVSGIRFCIFRKFFGIQFFPVLDAFDWLVFFQGFPCFFKIRLSFLKIVICKIPMCLGLHSQTPFCLRSWVF